MFLLIFLFTDGNSQEIFHKKITNVDSLPSNSVYDILQDDKGFIWFATDEGVCCFDGRHFKEFKSQNKSGKSGSFLKKDSFGRIWYENFDGYLNYIQNDSVFKIKQDNPMGFINYTIHKNQLTFATQDGFEVLDLKKLKTIKKQKIPNFRTCFIESAGGKTNFFDPNLKILTFNKTILSSSEKYLGIPLAAPIFTTSNTIYCTDKSNVNKKMYKIENGKIKPLFEFNCSQTIQNLYFLQNKFWLCTNKGLFVLDINGKELNTIPYFNDISITSFYIDSEDKYWVGTLNDGVFWFSDFNEIQSDLQEKKPLLLSAENSNLYIGSENGNIYSISNNFENIKQLSLQCKNQILYINSSHPKFNFIAADGIYKTNKNFEVLDHQNYALKSIDFVTDNEAIVAVSGFIGFANIGKTVVKSDVGNFQYTDNLFHLKENVRGKGAVWNPIDKEALFLTNIGLFSYKNNQLKELKLIDKKTGFRSIKKANNLIYILTDNDKLYQYNYGQFFAIKTGLENISFFKTINNTIYLGVKFHNIIDES